MNVLQISQDPISIQMSGAPVSAGFPIPQEAEHGSRVSLDEHLFINKNSSFLFRVVGDSMVDAGIFEDDRIIVDKSLAPQHNDIVLAVVDGEFTVKRLFMKNGIVRLIPENPKYKPIDFDEGQQLQVWGVVTTALRKLK